MMQISQKKRPYQNFIKDQGLEELLLSRLEFDSIKDRQDFTKKQRKTLEKSKNTLMTNIIRMSKIRNFEDFSFGKPPIGFGSFFLKYGLICIREKDLYLLSNKLFPGMKYSNVSQERLL